MEVGTFSNRNYYIIAYLAGELEFWYHPVLKLWQKLSQEFDPNKPYPGLIIIIYQSA